MSKSRVGVIRILVRKHSKVLFISQCTNAPALCFPICTPSLLPQESDFILSSWLQLFVLKRLSGEGAKGQAQPCLLCHFLPPSPSTLHINILGLLTKKVLDLLPGELPSQACPQSRPPRSSNYSNSLSQMPKLKGCGQPGFVHFQDIFKRLN